MRISHLAISPIYIIVLIMCIGFLLFFRKDKGFFMFMGKIYAYLHIVVYFISFYFYLYKGI
ncbi:hypothetical protein AN964_22820 [Heyndrickxia shackletonii]|uniref:Uncharacterized protein n=1 Tax=Heyndrickxia shackletonii TaxID=157838 RepID=A0A0Q3WRC8_9BACI|nr:hypothetical protein AN964_22820 [Heyndrickxia shackletonii]